MPIMQTCLVRPGLFPHILRNSQADRAHANAKGPSHWKRKSAPTTTAAAAGSSVGSEVVASATSTLLKAIEATQRGVSTSAEARQQIELIISVLEKEPTCSSDDGVWELLWTTERVRRGACGRARKAWGQWVGVPCKVNLQAYG